MAGSERPERLRDGAGRRISWDQFETWVVAQAIRNELEAFHGGGALDPSNPGSESGFITDEQMRALNIAIRRVAHEALREMRAAVRTIRASRRRQLYPEEEQEMLRAMRYCSFQLATVSEYMEPPGTPELDQAYERYVIGAEQ